MSKLFSEEDPFGQKFQKQDDDFTEEDHLKEKYRKQEAFLNDRWTELAQYNKLRLEYMAVLEEKNEYLEKKEAELNDREAKMLTCQAERAEKDALKRKAILFIRAKGCSNEEIAQALELDLDDVVSVE